MWDMPQIVSSRGMMFQHNDHHVVEGILEALQGWQKDELEEAIAIALLTVSSAKSDATVTQAMAVD